MITDDTQAVEATENDFAAFEAAANAAEPQPAEAKPEEEASPVDEAEEAKDEPTDEVEEEQEDEAPKKRRSKPASERIAELTARLRETERERDALRTGPTETKEPVKPDPSAYEFGEADPDYLDALTDYKIEVRDAEKAKVNEVEQSKTAMLNRLNTGVALAEETAREKYEDFDTKIKEAVAARNGEPMPVMLTVGIGVSPVGGDILYRLASDDAEAERIEKLAATGGPGFALALGQIEGEYLDNDADDDLDLTDQADVLRMLGRMKARLKGARAPEPKKATIATTNAPEPPKQRMRGGSGQFGVSPDKTDFAAFEKLASAGR